MNWPTQKKIEDIIIEFKKARNRNPTNEEIMDELDNTVSIEMINQTKKTIAPALADENV